MKTLVSLLIIIVLASLDIQAGDSPPAPNSPPLLSKPTWSGDDHDQPVYTSPTNAPVVTNLPAANLPPMTNLPTTNLPAMTNPPALQPPSGLHGA